MRKRSLWVSGRFFSKVKLKKGILASRCLLSKTRLLAMGLMCMAVVAVPLMSKSFAAPRDLDLSLVSSRNAAADIYEGDEVLINSAVQPADKLVAAGTINLPSALNTPLPSRDRKAFAPARDKGREIPARCERWRDFL